MSVERATKRESGLFSSLFPWRFYKAGLSIVISLDKLSYFYCLVNGLYHSWQFLRSTNEEVTTPPARNAKNQSHPLRRQQMCGHLSV
ncbi:hypothetical protein RHMOL_Rhmol12G0134800 [Rhododendron molle]|uniref:Uncharacterized protein n=1 Tax=Rhododendron molle TaxID=49168 RepID=A0ACC0LHN3_RHOML|nr:hypothetical protein RHMOL_Rhmol12G0134800 [Rhododendron molle]